MQAETQRGKNRAFKEASKLLPTALLPVVVDAKMLTQKSWTGNLSLALGNELYVDFHEPGEADGAMIARSVLNKHEGRRGAHDWDVFISHEWGVHDTAKDLALRLDRDHGLKVWLDEKEMHGKINEAMAEGIGRSKVFLILATARYLEKVNSGSGEENCCKEFTYASAQAQPTVVAALEPAMLRVTSLTADGNTFNVDLGGAPVIDLTSDTEASMRQLVRAIKERQTTTSDDDALPKGLRELRARLDPLDSSRWARRKADAFSPGTRRWILDFVQDWYEKSDERVIVVQGDGGVGKSTVLAELCRRGGALGGDEIAPESQKRISMRQRLSRRSGKGAGPMPVAAIHFFRHDRDAAKSTTTALRSIAWQLCSALPGFAAALEQGLMAKTSDELQALEDVFDTVLAAPAAKVDETHPPRGRHVVVLDALDECGNTAQFIQKIIVQRWTAKLPPWLCLLVSTRPEAQIPELMQGFRAKKLEVSDEKNRADLRLHLERILRGEVVENEVGAVADELTERSGGLFLWASFLPDTLRRLRRETGMERDTLLRRQDVVGEEWFPSGLSGMFRKYFARFRDEAMGGKDRYELVLAPIVAAREPLSKELVHAALGEPTMQATEQLIQKGRNLLYQTGSGGVGLLHKSMADWLTDADQDEDFHVDKEKGDALLAEVLLQREDDPFSVKHLVHHLVRCGRGEDAFARLNEFSWVRRVISQGEDQDQRRRAISALLRDCIELGIFDAEESETPRFLSKATSALSWDPRELASQVLGRLAKAGEVEHPLLQSLEVPTGGPWLRPVKTSLPHPRDPLLQVLQGPPTSYVHGAGVDGDMVVTASSDALVRVWSALSGELQQVLEGHTGEVTSVALQGELAVSGSQDKTVRLWNTRTGEPQSVLEGHTDFVTGVALQDGVVISGSKDKTVRLWNVATGALQHVFKGHKDEVMSVAVDGDCVISGSRDQTVRLWDAKTYKPKRVLKGHSSAVMGVAVQGDLVVSGSEDKSARVWSARTGSQQHVLEGHLFAVVSVAIQGDLVVTGSWDATVRVWEARTGQLQHELTGHSLEVTGVAIQGERVVSTSWDTTVRVWNAHPDGADYKLESHALSTEGVAVDGDTVVSGSLDQTVRVWNGATGALQHVLAGHTSYVYGVAVEGDVVVSGSDDSNVCLWDARSGELRHVLDDHTMCVKSVAISEGVVASGSWDKTVRLWDARSGELLRVLEGHEGWVVHVAMDGEYVLSGSMDSTVRLWRKRTGEQILKHRFSGPIAALELRAGALRVGYYDGSGGPRRDSWFVLSDPLSPTLREVQTLPDALLPSIEVENGTHLSIRGMPAKDGQRESGAGPVPSGSSVGFTTDNIIHRYTQQGDIVVIGELGGMVHILHVDRQ